MSNKSEIARLRDLITSEFEQSQHLFTDFAPTGRHQMITQKEENIAGHFNDLLKIVPPEEAMQIFIQAEKNVK